MVDLRYLWQLYFGKVEGGDICEALEVGLLDLLEFPLVFFEEILETDLELLLARGSVREKETLNREEREGGN